MFSDFAYLLVLCLTAWGVILLAPVVFVLAAAGTAGILALRLILREVNGRRMRRAEPVEIRMAAE